MKRKTKKPQLPTWGERDREANKYRDRFTSACLNTYFSRSQSLKYLNRVPTGKNIIRFKACCEEIFTLESGQPNNLVCSAELQEIDVCRGRMLATLELSFEYCEHIGGTKTVIISTDRYEKYTNTYDVLKCIMEEVITALDVYFCDKWVEIYGEK